MPRKVSLRPIEPPVIKQEVDSKHITEQSSMDDYLEADTNEKRQEFKDSERNEMSDEIIRLRETISVMEKEIQDMKFENGRLMSENNSLKNELNDRKPTKSDETIISENKTLISMNNSLKEENTRVLEKNRVLMNQISEMKSVYTKTPYDERITVVNRINTKNVNYNGYQDWR